MEGEGRRTYLSSHRRLLAEELVANLERSFEKDFIITARVVSCQVAFISCHSLSAVEVACRMPKVRAVAVT